MVPHIWYPHMWRETLQHVDVERHLCQNCLSVLSGGKEEAARSVFELVSSCPRQQEVLLKPQSSYRAFVGPLQELMD